MGIEKLTCIHATAGMLPCGPERSLRWRRVVKLGGWRSVCVVFLLCAATAVASSAQTFTSLVSFDGSNGSQPNIMSLIQGTDGDLHGTTPDTVFKITPGGTLTTLSNLTYGFYSTAGLVQATDFNFYGTTEEGGADNGGTIFRITRDGTLTTLYSFCAQPGCGDGDQPDVGLVQAANGSLYGTTQIGGANGYGTVFKITLEGKLTTVYSFCGQTNCADGSYPNAPLVQATDGHLYGTTLTTFFRISSDDALTTIHTFNGGDGIFGGMVQATDGNFYASSVYDGNGSIFKITPSGVVTTIYSFCSVFVGGKCLDGIQPYGALIQATDGNFYGTTYLGGANSLGTIFKITPGGTLTTLHNFCAQTGCNDGAEPLGGLVQSTNGRFYGTTWAGGAYDEGTAFSLSVGLGPFVKTMPTVGKVGTNVTILGTNLTGATSVTFNGMSAAFKVVSSSEIATMVPNGATTGEVQVTTPHRTLSSNPPFHVTN
jgi:uncharacterized repeat protein (TIGR03803 family)